MSVPTFEVLDGHDALEALSSLCQRIRCADPQRRAWEAADIQWWWRRSRRTDELGQLTCRDDTGTVSAAIVLTDFGEQCQLDVLTVPGCPGRELEAVWGIAADRARSWAGSTLEAIVDVHDEPFDDALRSEGFTDGEDAYVDAWLDAADRPPGPPLPGGFHLFSQAARPTSPHHLVARNEERVASRLAQCSLYDPELDLYVIGPDDAPCAYGLFWADPVTKVGLVEPMRTEAPHEHRGIASHVLAVGVDLLAQRGCDRLKVSSGGGLYVRAGFTPGPSARTLVRSAPRGAASIP
ncbi:MAG TPA: hypothetical protein VMQ40_04835 [Acidimicrobiales bacterium]|jgi:hypothetical protein|nr:hypothetical protein [Acidimicrobiales bacterium]